MGSPGAAKDAAKHEQYQATNKSGANMKPSSLPSDNSKLGPREPPYVPEGDIEKRKETKSEDDTDADLGWELVENPSDVWAKENEAMNKLIDDLDDMFLPSVAGKNKRQAAGVGRPSTGGLQFSRRVPVDAKGPRAVK